MNNTESNIRCDRQEDRLTLDVVRWIDAEGDPQNMVRSSRLDAEKFIARLAERGLFGAHTDEANPHYWRSGLAERVIEKRNT